MCFRCGVTAMPSASLRAVLFHAAILRCVFADMASVDSICNRWNQRSERAEEYTCSFTFSKIDVMVTPSGTAYVFLPNVGGYSILPTREPPHTPPTLEVATPILRGKSSSTSVQRTCSTCNTPAWPSRPETSARGRETNMVTWERNPAIMAAGGCILTNEYTRYLQGSSTALVDTAVVCM